MKESTTYQAIVEEGEIKGARRLLLRMGRKRLGPPDKATATVIQAIEDYHHLERLGDLLFEVQDWPELLAKGAARRREGRRKGTAGER